MCTTNKNKKLSVVNLGRLMGENVKSRVVCNVFILNDLWLNMIHLRLPKRGYDDSHWDCSNKTGGVSDQKIRFEQQPMEVERACVLANSSL